MAQQFNANVNILGTLTAAGLATFDGGADLSAEQIVNLAAGSASGHAVEYDQMNAAISAALVGHLEYKGTYDASTEPGSPDLTAADVKKGDFYLVTAAGSLNSVSLDVGDHIVFSADVAAAVAPTANDWDKIDNTAAAGSLTGLTDVGIDAAAQGDFLGYNGSQWTDYAFGAEFSFVHTDGSEAVSIASVDASKITYTPAVLTDWNGDVDPGDLDDALNQLAERVDDNEIAIGNKAESSVVTEIDANVDDLITLSGVAENASDLGTFTGTTIADASTIKAALQSLETAVEAGSDDQTAAEVPYTPAVLTDWDGDVDPGSTKDALDQLAERVDDNEIAIANKAESSVVTEIDANVDDLITLSGVAENSSDLGTFTGATIADSSTVKAALQALETEVEQKIEASDLPGQYSALIGNGALTTIAVNHALGLTEPKRVHISMYDESTGEPVYCDSITFTDGNSLSLVFISAPALNSIRLVITQAE